MTTDSTVGNEGSHVPSPGQICHSSGWDVLLGIGIGALSATLITLAFTQLKDVPVKQTPPAPPASSKSDTGENASPAD